MALDIVLGVVLAGLAYRGYRTGFAFQMIPIFALTVTILFTRPFIGILADDVPKSLVFAPMELRPAVFTILVALGLYLVTAGTALFCLSTIRHKMPKLRQPTPLDRIFGVFASLSKAGLLLGAAVLLLEGKPWPMTEPKVAENVGQSKILGIVAQVPFVPKVLETAECQFLGKQVQMIVSYRGQEEKRA